MIDADAARRIIPKWHDESVLNRYLITNPPHKVLTPSYHWPDGCPKIFDKWKARGKDLRVHHPPGQQKPRRVRT